MIKITDKKDCCGCSACVQRCPKQCIKMIEDSEGFLYPVVDETTCIDCGLCEKVCPIINKKEERKPQDAYAAINSDEEIRRNSSSGGIFTPLAYNIIDRGGVVFGASFNEHWEVAHCYTETREGIAAFRGSKYVQSIIGETFKQAESFLKQGREVLFSGTPCQIAGLKAFLRKEYENLTTIDFICHGTPSPGVFRWYIGEQLEKVARKSNKKYSFALQPIPNIPKADALAAAAGYTIEGIRFRDKREGWKKFSFALNLSEATAEGEKNSVSLSYTIRKSVFLRGFLKDLYLRPSCHNCPAKAGRSGSDITLADYWGIYTLIPKLDDDKGVSAIIVNSDKGAKLLAATDANLYPAPIEDICYKNPAYHRPTAEPTGRKHFFANNGQSFHNKIEKLCKVSIKTKIKRLIKDIAFTIFSAKALGNIKRKITK